jgi:transcription factor C subunit 7
VEALDKKHKKILIMSHAATVIALTHVLAGDNQIPMRVACCSLTTLKRPRGQGNKNSGAWVVETLTEGAFMANGLERDWGFEDVVLEGGKVCFYLVIRASRC